MKYFLLVISLLLLVNCSSNRGKGEKSSNDTGEVEEWKVLKNEVLAIHDSSMKYMGEIKKLKKEIKTLLESSENKDSLEIVLKMLQKADDDMWEWMHNYKPPDEKTTSPDSLLQFFQKEKEKIIKVDSQIRNSIRLANKLLQNG